MSSQCVTDETPKPGYDPPEIQYAKLKSLAKLLRELRQLAGDLEQPTLHFLIDMAELEVSQHLEQIRYQTDRV